jgi:hypothetical protein
MVHLSHLFLFGVLIIPPIFRKTSVVSHE